MTRAEELARAALGRVLGPDVAMAMRADTPLDAVMGADAVAIAVAVRDHGAGAGCTVLLGDADLARVRTLADLTNAIDARLKATAHA